jgi:hypothetical protein
MLDHIEINRIVIYTVGHLVDGGDLVRRQRFVANKLALITDALSNMGEFDMDVFPSEFAGKFHDLTDQCRAVALEAAAIVARPE